MLTSMVGAELRSVMVGRFFGEGVQDLDTIGTLYLELDDQPVALRGASGGGDYLTCEILSTLPQASISTHDWAIRPFVGELELVGRRLTRVTPLKSQFGLVAGLRLDFDGAFLTYLSQADEHELIEGDDSQALKDFGFSVLSGTLPTTSTRS